MTPVRPLIADETKLMACIHCGFCSPTCPTYVVTRDESESPRGRIYYIRALREGRVDPTPEVVGHLDHCLACFACETACPSGVKYRDLIEDARAWLGEGGGKRMAAEARMGKVRGASSWKAMFSLVLPSRALTRLLLAPFWVAERLGLRGLLARVAAAASPGWMRSSLRLLPARIPVPVGGGIPARQPAVGATRLRVAYLAGCVMEGSLPDLNRLQIAVLRALGCEVITPPGAGCCGALALHEGEKTRALALGGATAAALAAVDADVIVASAAGCGSTMKDWGHLLGRPEVAAKVRDFTEVAADLIAERPPTRDVPLRVAYQDACHLIHGQKITAPPRALLRAIPGLTVVELPEQEICCGSAGVYNLVEPEMAGALGARKAAHAAAAGVDAIVTANPGCLLQLRAHGGPDGPRVLHLAEVLGMAYGVGP